MDSPIEISDGESDRESPMFIEQEDDEDMPAESGSPESASEQQEGATISPENDDAESSQDDDDTPSGSESASTEQQEGATISLEGYDAESSQDDEDDEGQAQAAPAPSEGSPSPEAEPVPDQDGSDHGDDDDQYASEDSEDHDDNEGIAICGGVLCQEQCDQYERRLDAKDKRNEALRIAVTQENANIRALRNKVTDLATQVWSLGGEPVWGTRRRRRKSTTFTPRGMSRWQNLLRSSISGEGSYDTAWKSSQQTLNMPVDNDKTHPGIRFIEKPGPDEPDNLSPEGDSITLRMPEGVQLPDNVLFRILDHLLSYEGFLCHCISRLDRHESPESFPSRRELGRKRTGIRGRFFFSKEQRTQVSLTYDTLDPNNVLAALLVSRKCAFYGIHIFYGRNTFAFSSIGEFGRAMKGWGVARVQRLQNVELAWLGGRVVRFSLPSGQRRDARSQPLEWLAEMSNLKTLVILIEETSRSVIRRPNEPEDRKSYLHRKMQGKCQGRMTRALRCCRGMDYVTLLRGLWWVRMLDLDKQLKGASRRNSGIRDLSFTIDLNRAVTQEKKPREVAKSRTARLEPLFPACDHRWNPGAPDFELVQQEIYDEQEFLCRENDLDYDVTSSQGTIGSDFSDDDGGGSDDDDDDNSFSGSVSRTPRLYSRKHRPFTPAPGPADSEDESQNSASDGSNQRDSGSGSDEEDAESVTTEMFRLRRVRQFDSGHLKNGRARSEGGSVSHISGLIRRAGNPAAAVEIIDDDDNQDVIEVPPPPTARISTAARSQSLFVTPGPNEPRSTGTPDWSTRHRSTTNGLPTRRASSAPHNSLTPVIDLTEVGSDEEAENSTLRKDAYPNVVKVEEPVVELKVDTTNDVDKARRSRMLAKLNTGTKRTRGTSVTSQEGDTKRQKSQHGVRTGSLPLTLPPTSPNILPLPAWNFLKDS